MEVVNQTLNGLSVGYQQFASILPLWLQTFISLFLIVIIVVLYAVFVWKFYRFVSHKNIIGLDLNKYNRSTHPLLVKLVASALYLVEYIIILPFLIFFWFAIFTFLLVLLAGVSVTLKQILLISAIVVASIRMASYIPGYGENVSEEIAKMLPYLILATTLLEPQALVTDFFPKLLTRLENFPVEMSGIPLYLLFIVLLEIILRVFDFFFSLIGLNEELE